MLWAGYFRIGRSEDDPSEQSTAEAGQSRQFELQKNI
jgi:hypothetical protein